MNPVMAGTFAKGVADAAKKLSWDKINRKSQFSQFNDEETSGFFCDKCQYPQKESKEIRESPECLIVILDRFSESDRKDNESVEIATPFRFDSKSSYSLYGVICHSGMGLSSGHYFSYVKRSNTWYSCNDTYVSEVRPSNSGKTKTAE